MSNALAISPSIMINRLVDRSGTPMAASLAKVAELRMALQTAVEEEQARVALLDPTGEAKAPAVTSGAVVDRLI
jgi:hypothetical protein